MQQKYRVLKAMRELGEFTVSRLMDATGVPQQTIRTILLRNPEWVTKDATRVETGRPGGQFTRYQLTEQGRAQMERLLDELTSGSEGTGEPSDIPITLLTANDTLSRRLPEAETPGRRKFLLDSAKSDLEVARAQIEAHKNQGYNPSGVFAELQSVEAFYTFQVTGAVPAEMIIKMSQRMLWSAWELGAAKQVSGHRIERSKLEAAARRFGEEFAAFVPKKSQDPYASALAERLKSKQDSFAIPAKALPYFGIAPSVYAPGVLHEAHQTNAPNVDTVQLRIFIPRLLESIDDNRNLAATPLEREIAEELEKAADLEDIRTVRDGKYVDVYAPLALAHAAR